MKQKLIFLFSLIGGAALVGWTVGSLLPTPYNIVVAVPLGFLWGLLVSYLHSPDDEY